LRLRSRRLRLRSGTSWPWRGRSRRWALDLGSRGWRADVHRRGRGALRLDLFRGRPGRRGRRGRRGLRLRRTRWWRRWGRGRPAWRWLWRRRLRLWLFNWPRLRLNRWRLSFRFARRSRPLGLRLRHLSAWCGVVLLVVVGERGLRRQRQEHQNRDQDCAHCPALPHATCQWHGLCFQRNQRRNTTCPLSVGLFWD